MKSFIINSFKFLPSLNRKYMERFFYFYNQKAEHKNDFVSIHFRPVKSENIGFDYVGINNKTGILIQGPVNDIKFLIETIKIYKILFPSVPIVVSTWNDEKREHLAKLRLLDIHLVINEKPKVTGVLNVNYQIISTLNGLKYMNQLGVQYALKSRTDCRTYSSRAIDLCVTLLENYTSIDEKQYSRIILIDFNTTKYRPFSYSDIFQFSDVNELLKYWSCPLDHREIELEQIKNENDYTFRFCSENYLTESYFGRHYISTIGCDYSNRLSVSLKHIKERFVVIDKEMIDHYWNKYTSYEYEISEQPMYSNDRQVEKIKFSEWFMMQNKHDFQSDSEYLDKKRK